jgi:putative membrane protein
MHHHRLLFVSLACAWLAGCSQTPAAGPTTSATTTQTQSVAETQTPSAPSASATSAALSGDDERLLKQVAEKSLAEFQIGELAVKQAANAEVKAIGQQLIDDHNRMKADLDKLATAKNLQLPTEPDSEGKDKISDLQKLQGADFDKEFLSEMVEEHREDIDFYSKGAQSAADPEVKAVAETSLVVLRMHLDKMVRLADKLGVKPD